MNSIPQPSAPPGLPAPVRERLAELQRALEPLLGDRLVALIVHGSAARGEYRPGASDVDLVVVLREAPRPLLEAIANPLQIARSAARIESMILLEAEIPGAADVFPLLYDDLRRHHVLVAGRDPFAAIAVRDEHRRLRIEQELRETAIRLRRLVVDAATHRPLLVSGLERKVKALRAPLFALLQLRGSPPAEDQVAAVYAHAGRVLDLDIAPLPEVAGAPERAHAALERLLTRALAEVAGAEGRT